MTREKKLEAIYQEMANKELTPWCCVEVKAQNEYGDFTYRLSRWDERPTSEIKEIIGHPVMIGDVMYYIRKKYWNNHSWFHSDRSKLIDLRSKEREPIEWQYDDCIRFRIFTDTKIIIQTFISFFINRWKN